MPEDLDERLPLDYSPDDDTTVPHAGPPEMAAEIARRQAEQDTVDDVAIWLEIAEKATRAGRLKSDAVDQADHVLSAFRDRWPRRDTKDPLGAIR